MDVPSPSAAEPNNVQKMRDKDMRHLAINAILISSTAFIFLNPDELINDMDTVPYVCLLSLTLLVTAFFCQGLGFLLFYLCSKENKTALMLRMQKALGMALASLVTIGLCGFVLQALSELFELDDVSKPDMNVVALTDG